MPRVALTNQLAGILCVPVEQLVADSVDLSQIHRERDEGDIDLEVCAEGVAPGTAHIDTNDGMTVNIENSSIKNNRGVVGIGSVVETDTTRDALLDYYGRMTPIQRARLLIAAHEMINESDRTES